MFFHKYKSVQRAPEGIIRQGLQSGSHAAADSPLTDQVEGGSQVLHGEAGGGRHVLHVRPNVRLRFVNVGQN